MLHAYHFFWQGVTVIVFFTTSIFHPFFTNVYLQAQQSDFHFFTHVPFVDGMSSMTARSTLFHWTHFPLPTKYKPCTSFCKHKYVSLCHTSILQWICHISIHFNTFSNIYSSEQEIYMVSKDPVSLLFQRPISHLAGAGRRMVVGLPAGGAALIRCSGSQASR